MLKKVVFLFILIILLTSCKRNDEITISVASSLYEPISEIIKIYEKEFDKKVIVNSGSSGTLKKQIENGAEIDVFFSANESYVKDLVNKNIIQKQNVYYPISNSLVLIKNKNYINESLKKTLSEINKSNKKNELNDNIENGNKVYDKSIFEDIKISIGESSTVPLGIYSKEYLENIDIFENIKYNIIYGKDASSVKNYVESFNVDIGIIYKSDVGSLKNSEVVFEIPKDKHRIIRYSIASVSEEGKELVKFVLKNKEVFEKYNLNVSEDIYTNENLLENNLDEKTSNKNSLNEQILLDKNVNKKMIINSLFISFFITTVSVFISFLLALFKSYNYIFRINKKENIFETLSLLPVFLPPSAIGYIILILFSKNNIIGKAISDFGIEIIFSKLGAIIVSVIVTFSIMYSSIKNSVKSINKEILEAGEICGASKYQVFTKLILPLSKNGILTGIILSVARSFGEFGATILVAGNIKGKTQTLPMLLYFYIETNQTKNAFIVLSIIIFISIFMISLYKKFSEE